MLNFASEVPVPLSTLSSWSRGSLHEYLQQDSFDTAEARGVWRSLIESLRSSKLSEKQITSTCNCLRIYLKSTVSAQNLEIKRLPLFREEWLDCYEAVCSTWHKAKVKPLAQILEVLLQIAKNGMRASELESIWRSISVELSSIILSGQPARDLKRALALSSFFLEKGLSHQIYHESVLQNMKQGKVRLTGDKTSDKSPRQSLVHAIFLSFEQHDAQSSAEKFFKTLLKASVHHSSDMQSWWSLVRSFVADHADSLDAVAVSVFPVLLEQQTIDYTAVIQSLGTPKQKEDLLFLLAFLQSLRERELINESDLYEFLQNMAFKTTSNTPGTIGLILSHADDSVRIRALRLLATSKMTNAPISLPFLQHLAQTMYLWFHPGGPQERGETLSAVRKLLVRIRGGSSALGKVDLPSASDKVLLAAHQSLVLRLVDHVSDEICPHTSYQRRIMGLTLLKFLLDSNIDLCDRAPIQKVMMNRSADKSPLIHASHESQRVSNAPDWPFSVCLRQRSSTQNLLNLISDPYEDIRALSASFLRRFLVFESRTSHSIQFSEQLRTAIEILIPKLESEAAQTNRSDHADGLGRVYALLDLAYGAQHPTSHFVDGQDEPVIVRLVRRLENVMTDMSSFNKPDVEPLHSLLLGVMYCITENNQIEIHNRIIAICHQVWKGVIDRLCVDSPETAEQDADDLVEVRTGPRDMLSYCWRALRDSSLLLRALLNTSTSPTAQGEHDLPILTRIGDLCVEQLTMLRHRGAFSTVAQTFSLCCQRIMSIEGQSLIGVRLRWYQNAKVEVDQQADRLTRRSAGLPAMMAGILSPDDDLSFQSFIDSFIAKSEVRENDEISESGRLSLPQVHAMNTLREVMINSRFRAAVVPHLQKLLTLATRNLGSNIWAIQNCGLMLYRACLLRFSCEDRDEPSGPGSSNTSKSSSDAFDLATGLLKDRAAHTKTSGVILNTSNSHIPETSIGNELVGVEQRFAALDMIAHIRPTIRGKSNVRTLLLDLLDSPIWLVRQRAAEVLTLLTPTEGLLNDFETFSSSMEAKMGQNSLHGRLLYWRELLRRWLLQGDKMAIEASLEQLGQQLALALKRLSGGPHSPSVMAALYDTANNLLEQSLRAEISIDLSLVAYEGLLQTITDHQGFYLVKRSVIYNAALNLLAAHKPHLIDDKVSSTLQHCLSDDPDVTKYLLEKLLGQDIAFPPEELFRLGFLSMQMPPNVSSLATSMLALSVEKFPSEWDCSKIQQVLNLLTELPRTREVIVSAMVAKARIFSLLALQKNDRDASRAILSSQQLSWRNEVQHAAQDEMNTFTRLQAANAISAYLPCLMELRYTFDAFALLLTLHGLLNDDDEDVRYSAAQTASAFMRNGGATPTQDLLAEGLCAPAITIQLEDYLRSRISRIPFQSEILLCRLLSTGSEIDLEEFLHNDSVQKQLSRIKDEGRALFAVERQNLYIDEVHNIHFWSSLCRANNGQTSVIVLESVQSTLASWVSDGLEVLRILLGEAEQSLLLPDVTFDLDILLLCVRVVDVAGTYLSLSRGEVKTGSKHESIYSQLRALKMLASQRQFSPELTRTIDDNLEMALR